MTAGIGFTAFYIIATVFFGMERWTFGVLDNGIDPQGIGTLGMVLNFAVTLGLTPSFDPPSEATRQLVDGIREPESPGPALEIETSASH
jgi:cation/acetate symporter